MLGREELGCIVDYVIVENICSSLHPLIKRLMNQSRSLFGVKIASLYQQFLKFE
jgi:hypothetical protein